MKIIRFTFFFILLAASICWTGCRIAFHPSAIFESHTNPLVGFHFSSLGNLDSNKAITDDYKDYIQKLPPNARNYVGQIFYYEDGTGQHAVDIEIDIKGENADRHIALIYDKENKRIKVVKYGYTNYES